MGICVIIPAYNAEASIAAVIKEAVLAGYPLLVVDDGSNDATAAKVAALNVTLLSHAGNQGKGAALRSGFDWALQAGYSGVVTIDADGQHDPTAIARLVREGETTGAGIVLASRFAQFDEMGGLRRIWNRFGAWCMKKRTGFNIDDSQSGFRYYAAELLRAVPLMKTGYDLEMELLMKAWQSGFTIRSIPVAARVVDGRGTSHFRPVRDTWNICMTFLRYM